MKTFIDIEAGGFKSGELAVIAARQTGKSMLTKYQYYTSLDTNLCQEIMLTAQQLTKLSMMKLNHNAPKYKFSRKWHIANFKWQDYNEVNRWCIEQFGPHPQNPDAWCRWAHYYEDQIHFRDERDYNWFILRWGA